MNLLRSSLLPLFGLVALGAHADPIRLDDVPAGSVWFGHLDIDKASSGKLGEMLREQLGRAGAVPDEGKEVAGLDLLKTLRGITFYGDGSKENITILLYHSGAGSDFRAKILEAGKVKALTVDGIPMLELNTKVELEAKADDERLFLAIPEDGPAIAAGTPQQVVAAVKRPAGKGVRAPEEWADSVGGGPVLVLSCFCESLPADAMQSQQLRQVKSATFAADAEGDALRLRLKGTMTSAEAASAMAELAKAFAGCLRTGPAQEKAVQSLKVEHAGPRISLEAPLSLTRLAMSMKVEVREPAEADENSKVKVSVKVQPPADKASEAAGETAPKN